MMEHNIQSEEREFKALLDNWSIPEPAKSLEDRVLASYRQQLKDNEVLEMKYCQTCDEKVESSFSFCPTDGTPLSLYETSSYKSVYHLTMLEDDGLSRRLSRALAGVARQSQLTWPEFKRDPFEFTNRFIVGYGTLSWQFITRPNVALASLSAILFVMTLIGLVILFDRYKGSGQVAKNELEVVEWVNFNSVPEAQQKVEEGPAGTAKGQGGGQKPKFEKPAGGGGGGRNELKEASAGKLPTASLEPQIKAPEVNPPVIKNQSLPVTATIKGDQVLLPTDNRPIPYGDLKSKSNDPSSGQGTGGGIGSGTGGGVGSGEGGGVGPGRGGNTGGGDFGVGGGGRAGGGGGDYSRIFSSKEVTKKVVIISKPEPGYTEEARKNNVTGTVMLRVVFSASGQVTNVVPLKRLPDGLTEKAIAAAKQIKFTPAMKDGRAVSSYITLEYTFNIY